MDVNNSSNISMEIISPFLTVLDAYPKDHYLNFNSYSNSMSKGNNYPIFYSFLCGRWSLMFISPRFQFSASITFSMRHEDMAH